MTGFVAVLCILSTRTRNRTETFARIVDGFENADITWKKPERPGAT
jgi:hypothetical protein